MIVYEESQLREIFDMYLPLAIYLTRVEIYPSKTDIDSPDMIAQLQFPPKPIYLVENTGIQHINNTEVAFIINQSVFVFYRWVLINGELGFPQIPIEKLGGYYDRMFLKREIHYYERFTSRSRTDLIVQFQHINRRKVGTAHMVSCELLIPGFLKADIVGGIELGS